MAKHVEHMREFNSSKRSMRRKMRIFLKRGGVLDYLSWRGLGGMEYLKGDPRASPCML